MKSRVRQMMTCHWAARRVQRYLDADPDAPLSPPEVSRLEEHVATCERCAELLAAHRGLHRALSRWSRRQPVDPASVDRLRGVLDDLTRGRTS